MSDAPLDEVEELLITILTAAEQGADVEELIAKYPEHADELRRRLEHLDRLGLQDRFGTASPPIIKGFKADEILGRGGMAEVWAATRESDGQRVALKVLRDRTISPALRERFRREALALGKLDHPGIVGVHATGESDGIPYIAMELIAGDSLDTLIGEGRSLDVRRVVTWGRDIAQALAAAHAAGIVHRDLKPSNILVTRKDRVVVVDFGLTRGLTESTMTVTGSFIGSPHYASPEQVRGDRGEVGPPTDLYSLGVTLYEALAGRLPFEGSRAEELFHQILSHDPVPLRKLNPKVSSDLGRVIEKAIEKSPVNRYASAKALAADLDAVLELRDVQARAPGPGRRLRRWSRRRPATTAALAVLMIAILVVTGATIMQRRESRLEREESARRELSHARELLDRHREASRDLPDRIIEFKWRLAEIHREVNSPEQIAAFDKEQRLLEQTQTEGEKVFTEVMEILRRAEDLDPDLVGPERLRARLYLERWRIARADRNQIMVDFLAAKVREHDREGDLALAVRPTRRLTLVTDPPGARVDAFVYRRHDDLVPGGQPRLVPVPLRGADGPAPGSPALRVRRASAPLMPEDLIVAVGDRSLPSSIVDADEVPSMLEIAEAGGLPARIWRDGREFEVELPVESVLRTTAAPLFHGESSLIGHTPLREVEVEGDGLLLLIRAEGFEPERVSLAGASRTIDLKLIPLGRDPAPFIKVNSHYGDTMLVMDREVTCSEYLEFLNSDAMRSVPDERETFLPKTPTVWPLGAGGSVVLPAEVVPKMPAQGMSWRAATAYANWRTRRAQDEGRKQRFLLPDWRRFQVFLRTDGSTRRFPWGNHFRPTYAKSCFSRTRPCLEPVLSFSVDETITGLFDTAGSVSELCNGWFWQERGQRPAHGGSWQHAEPARFESTYAWGAEADEAFDHLGFRLELVIDDD